MSYDVFRFVAGFYLAISSDIANTSSVRHGQSDESHDFGLGRPQSSEYLPMVNCMIGGEDGSWPTVVKGPTHL